MCATSDRGSPIRVTSWDRAGRCCTTCAPAQDTHHHRSLLRGQTDHLARLAVHTRTSSENSALRSCASRFLATYPASANDLHATARSLTDAAAQTEHSQRRQQSTRTHELGYTPRHSSRNCSPGYSKSNRAHTAGRRPSTTASNSPSVGTRIRRSAASTSDRMHPRLNRRPPHPEPLTQPTQYPVPEPPNPAVAVSRVVPPTARRGHLTATPRRHRNTHNPHLVNRFISL